MQDFPRVHERALRYFADLFPSGPAPFLHPQHLEEAFALAASFNITSVGSVSLNHEDSAEQGYTDSEGSFIQPCDHYQL